MKYLLIAEGKTRGHYRGRSYDTYGTRYKAIFLSLEKAKAKILLLQEEDDRIDRMTIYELDEKNRSTYTSGRQAPSGYYYGTPRTVSYYSNKKEIYKWEKED